MPHSNPFFAQQSDLLKQSNHVALIKTLCSQSCLWHNLALAYLSSPSGFLYSYQAGLLVVSQICQDFSYLKAFALALSSAYNAIFSWLGSFSSFRYLLKCHLLVSPLWGCLHTPFFKSVLFALNKDVSLLKKKKDTSSGMPSLFTPSKRGHSPQLCII